MKAESEDLRNLRQTLLIFVIIFIIFSGCETPPRKESREEFRVYNELAPPKIQEYKIKAERYLREICDVLTGQRKASCKKIKIEIVPTTNLNFATIYPNGLMRLETVSFIELNDEMLKSTIAHEVGHMIFETHSFGSQLKAEIEADKFEASITSKETALKFFYLLAELRVRLGLIKNANEYLERADIVARINALRSP